MSIEHILPNNTSGTAGCYEKIPGEANFAFSVNEQTIRL